MRQVQLRMSKDVILIQSDMILEPQQQLQPVQEEDCLDNTPVSPTELLGWYAYSWASEGYSALAIAIFYPIILQKLAATCGVQASDPLLPCDTQKEGYVCLVPVGNLLVSTTSFVFYSTTISVLLQFVLFMSIGALADYGTHRKHFLLFFGYATTVLGALILFVTSADMYLLAAVIFIFSNVCYGASFVFYYAYVPILTRYHPKVLNASSLSGTSRHDISERTANLISARGFSAGYVSAVILLLVGVAVAFVMGDGRRFGMTETYPLQIGIAITCGWFAFFLLFTMRWLKPRPGPPLPPNCNIITFSIQKVCHNISEARKLSQLFKFLLGWFIFSDGFSTLSSVALLFFQTEIPIPQFNLLVAAIVAPFIAALGAIVWMRLQRYFNMSTQQVLVLQACLYCVIPIWGLIGFLTPPGSFGIRAPWEIYPLIAYHGFLWGATQSACRVQFAELLPPGKESQFFSLYELTDKGSAWIGPLVVGVIGDVTGSKRNAFWFLLLLLVLPIFIFRSVDVAEGKRDALRYAEQPTSSLDLVIGEHGKLLAPAMVLADNQDFLLK